MLLHCVEGRSRTPSVAARYSVLLGQDPQDVTARCPGRPRTRTCGAPRSAERDVPEIDRSADTGKSPSASNHDLLTANLSLAAHGTARPVGGARIPVGKEQGEPGMTEFEQTDVPASTMTIGQFIKFANMVIETGAASVRTGPGFDDVNDRMFDMAVRFYPDKGLMLIVVPFAGPGEQAEVKTAVTDVQDVVRVVAAKAAAMPGLFGSSRQWRTT